MIDALKKKVYNGQTITREEALRLWDTDLATLCASANDIRIHFCGNTFDLCTIINAKSGMCSENCAYCAQSMHHFTTTQIYPLLNENSVLKEALYNDQKQVQRFSMVTSGKALSDYEVDLVCGINRTLKQKTKLSLCGSYGLLNEQQFKKLKAAGVSRYHNNLETSKRYFPNICTTHSYDDKIQAIQFARKAGLEICSGGIIGMGETIEDRIDLALALRNLHVLSIPINILTPISGTPLANIFPTPYQDLIRTVAIFRFINPKAMIRLAGGRGTCKDGGKAFFLSGANAAITGDMLTTQGITIDKDKAMLKTCGFNFENYT